MKTHARYLFPAALLMAVALFIASLTPAKAFIGVSIGIAPPALPVYAQPVCPGAGYEWTPGYWAWDASYDDYYWVPGTWVIAPEIGFLWTPAWWGCDNGAYFFHAGYWGPRVGYYGGINYGYGYYGRGYDGGYWRGNHFYYNRAANNVANIDRARTFSRSVANTGSRVSFNGPGGTNARPTAAERAAARENHVAATAAQNAHIRAAAADPSLRASVNHGHPAVTATSRPGELRSTSAAAANRTTAQEHTAAVSRANNEQRAATAESRRTSESALTGESRAATEHHVAATSESRRTSESAFTGQSRAATERRTAATSERTTRSVAATESHRASAYHSAYHPTEARSFATRSASSYHAPAYHAPAYHSMAHASAFHAAAPRGGGGGFHGAPQASGGGGGARSGRR